MRKPDILLKIENNPILVAQVVEDVGPRVQQIIEAAITQPLQRYNLRPGRIFGTPNGKDRFKVTDLAGNVIVYKDLKKDKMFYENIDTLLAKWNMFHVVEISPVDAILEKIKGWLTPFLGAVLVAALISWLMKKLG